MVCIFQYDFNKLMKYSCSRTKYPSCRCSSRIYDIHNQDRYKNACDFHQIEFKQDWLNATDLTVSQPDSLLNVTGTESALLLLHLLKIIPLRPSLTNVMIVVAGGNTRTRCLVDDQSSLRRRQRRLSYLLQGANMPASF